MNYAKVVGAAMQLFPKKINVTVINEVTGAVIGKYKIPLGQLPAAFNKPTIIEIEGNVWRVVKADPVSSDDFSIFKKLTLHILEKDQWTDERLQFNVPTRHAYHALTVNTPVFDEFILDISEDDWRQVEFLPTTALPAIQEEITLIQPMLVTDLPGGLLWGYENLYERQKTADFPLRISLTDFCTTVQAQKMGGVRMYGNAFVQQAVAIESLNYTYYGMLDGDELVSLCLPAYDSIDDEFMNLVTTYNLVLADWCNARVVMIDTGAEAVEAPVQAESADQLGF
jgi:hypothetical protein